LSYRNQYSTGVGEARENSKTTIAKRKLKEGKKVELKANLSLIESVSRLDCGGWEKETTCGIRPMAAAGQPCFTSFGLKSDADLSCTSIWSGTSFTYSETNRTCVQ